MQGRRLARERRCRRARPHRFAAALLALVLLASSAIAWGERRVPIVQRSDRARAALSTRQKRTAIARYGLKAMALRRSFVKRHNADYDVIIPRARTPYEMRNQRQSGRCWLFAFDNVLQSKLAAKGVKPRDLSVSFLNYHALRTQAVALLNEAAKSRALPDLSRISQLDEGGHQPWARDLVRKHGIVPESAMRSTFDGNNSALVINQMRRLITAAYREIGRLPATKAGERRAKGVAKKYINQVEKLMHSTIGKPPRRFRVNGVEYTPKTYMQRKLGLREADLDYVVLMHDPERAFNRKHREFGDLGLRDFHSYNVSMATIQAAVKKTLRAGESVWFSANVDKGNPFRAGTTPAEPAAAKGILSLAAFDYAPYIPAPKLSKRERTAAGISMSDHAMALTAYQRGSGRASVVKWRVDNSWGRDHGSRGQFHMYDDYFRKYVDSVVVPRSVLKKAMLAKIDKKPTVGAPERKRHKAASRWTRNERRALVLQIMAGELSVTEAAQQNRLKEAVVQNWHDNALTAMDRALRQ